MGAFERVFVYYPRGLRTGGPEALHQLVDTLRRQTVDASLVPIPGTESLPRSSEYDVYDAPEAPFVDAPTSALVVPEMSMGLLGRASKATRFCWWLSIDNALPFRASRRKEVLWPIEREVGSWTVRDDATLLARRVRARFKRHRALMYASHHLTQSHYAWSYLHSRLNIVGSALSDYTPIALAEVVNEWSADRRPVITYNYAKSAAVMTQVIARNPDLQFLALRDMTRPQVLHHLKESLVHIDLGTHPGKDRMPREAALMGSIVLAVRRGSAANSIDVPLAWEHKISPIGDVSAGTRDAIDRVLVNPERAWTMQQFYRDEIIRERTIFREESRAIFVDGRLESDGVLDWLPTARY